MSGWTKVRWTQARQVTRLLGMRDADAPAEGITPVAHFDTLRARGHRGDAVSFLGQSLPRFEGVIWAADMVATLRGDDIPPASVAVMAAIRAWIDDPSDANRRAAYAAGEQAEEDSPERLLGIAVWLSGGSLAPADLQPVNPPPESCGRLVAAAVLAAVYGSPDPDAALDRVLTAGEAIARGDG
ncbi:MAG: hypothetical protein EOP58_07885 [Sphingomonadales bacterium]|nr:MAG: hypothetical protein EOP58_07885 [Sphingomonadales bacterium]